jgi:hypothetical protein
LVTVHGMRDNPASVCYNKIIPAAAHAHRVSRQEPENSCGPKQPPASGLDARPKTAGKSLRGTPEDWMTAAVWTLRFLRNGTSARMGRATFIQSPSDRLGEGARFGACLLRYAGMSSSAPSGVPSLGKPGGFGPPINSHTANSYASRERAVYSEALSLVLHPANRGQ